MSYGWGGGYWGFSGWGGGTPGTRVDIASIVIWAADSIQINFNVPACNDASLQSPSQYLVAPLLDGDSVSVLSVRSGTAATASSVFLVITPPTMGTSYRVILQNGITSADGASIVPGAYGDFHTRLTKIDSLLSTRPIAYDLRPSAVIRNLINALGREDDRIGGSQNENI